MCRIEVEHEGSKDMDPGIVLQQKGLTPGKRIDPDSKETITFVVSTYPSDCDSFGLDWSRRIGCQR